ncbi:MAG: serine/threonine protein kinase [Peptococcaceae bacterium]|nr:serine/threonine protein kinase [Peptococcaceae bacterium]
MSDIKKYEPLWGVWYVESLIGQGLFSKVYKVRRDFFLKTHYAAVKMITVPLDESEVRLMEREGLDDDAMQEFFQTLTRNLVTEIDLMSEFRQDCYAGLNSHIVNIEDYQIIEHEDSFVRDILIRMELLESLVDHVAEAVMPPSEVVKLGIHMCHALDLCSRKNVIHRNIKPDNIFVSAHGNYKLGDFGIARQIERTSVELSKKGANAYMAPEVFKYEAYGASADIYSLGIVLYGLLNRNRIPFMPAFPEPILPDNRTEALHRRMKGEPLPILKEVSPQLNDIVLKACAFNRSERFASPTAMREALEGIGSQ